MDPAAMLASIGGDMNGTVMPGYGLYDRALGVAYICGLWEAVEKERGSRG